MRLPVNRVRPATSNRRLANARKSRVPLTATDKGGPLRNTCTGAHRFHRVSTTTLRKTEHEIFSVGSSLVFGHVTSL